MTTAAETTITEKVDTSSPQNTTRLVKAIFEDATKLISQHFAMLRAEFREDLRRSRDAAKYLSVGLFFAVIGCLFLAVGLVSLLNTLVPMLPQWSCWIIVGAALIIIGAIALSVGKLILSSIHPLPNQTIAAIQEDVTWITKPRT